MNHRIAPVLAIAALLVAMPLRAEKAEVGPDGHRHCSPNYSLSLSETSRPGVYRLTYPVFFAAKFDTRTPAGMFAAPTGSFDGNIRIVLGGSFGRDGKPLSPLAVTGIKVAMGNLAAPPTSPASRVAMSVEAGGIKLPLPIDATAYRSAEISASLQGVGVARMAASIDGKSPTVVMLIDGKPVAKMSYDAASIAEARSAALAWARKKAPLLAKGDCGD